MVLDDGSLNAKKKVLDSNDDSHMSQEKSKQPEESSQLPFILDDEDKDGSMEGDGVLHGDGDDVDSDEHHAMKAQTQVTLEDPAAATLRNSVVDPVAAALKNTVEDHQQDHHTMHSQT